MLSSHSFALCLLLLVLTSLPLSRAQSDPDSIRNIDMGPTVDIYPAYDADKRISFCWDIYTGNLPLPGWDTFVDSSVELMNGTAEAAGNDVVDIVGIELAGDFAYCSPYYLFPSSLPLGQYHMRVNSTVNFTLTNAIQHVTARSGTINVTTSYPIGCEGVVPGPFTNVPSPSASSFTSLYLWQPSAGMNVVHDPNYPVDVLQVKWDFRDRRNIYSGSADGSGIANLTLQVIDSKNGSNVGPLQTVENPAENTDYSIPYSVVPMQVNGTYQIRVQYINFIQDGPVAPGGVVTYTTQEFNVVDYEEGKCPILTASTTSNSSSSSSTSVVGSLLSSTFSLTSANTSPDTSNSSVVISPNSGHRFYGTYQNPLSVALIVVGLVSLYTV